MVAITCGSVKWAQQQLGIKGEVEADADDLIAGSTGNIATSTRKYWFNCDLSGTGLTGGPHFIHGIQSAGYDTNFDITPVFEWCDFEPYEINEGLPSVSMTISKALDGYCPVYLALTKDAPNPTLAGRAGTKAHIAIAIFPCSLQSTDGDPNAIVVFPEVQVNSISYNFGTDDAFTEEIAVLGNNVLWFDVNGNISDFTDCSGCTLTTAFTKDLASINFPGCCPSGTVGPNPKVQFKEDFSWNVTSGLTSLTDPNGAWGDPDTTVVPPIIPGILCNGTNPDGAVCINSISVSTDLNREELFCLGKRGPVTRTITPPTTVNTAVEVVSEYGPAVSAVENGVCTTAEYVGGVCTGVGDNLQNQTIRIVTCAGLRLYTGIKNKLSSVSTTGGSTSGDNLTVTYTFQTFNVLTVMHENDCAPSGATWWTNRLDWLATQLS